MGIARLPGAVIIDGVSFVDCILRGVHSTEVVESGVSILIRNVKIEPASERPQPKLPADVAVRLGYSHGLRKSG
jgi:hypothetical protein